MEKPTKVEVGQRWRDRWGNEISVVAVFADSCPKHPGPHLHWSGNWGWDEINTPLKRGTYTYLGGPAVPPVMPAMKEGEQGFPFGCLQCGKTLGHDEAYECHACPEDGYEDRVNAWMAGARDFPRPAAPLVGVPRKPMVWHKTPQELAGASGTTTRVRPQGLSQHEHRNINGVAMSALEFIKSRKPPEPWRPSVDEFDLLPDVDVRR